MRRLKERWARRRKGFDLKEDLFYLEWQKRLQNIRFADDIMLFAGTLPQAARMLEELMEEAGKVGLEVHWGKTKILSNMEVRRGANKCTSVDVAGNKVEVLPPGGAVGYLGRSLSLQDPHEVELGNRITKGWAKFAVYKAELCDRRYSIVQRLRLFDAVVKPTVLYACGCWTMNANRAQKLKSAQRRMLRRMMGVARRGGGLARDEARNGSSQESSMESEGSSSQSSAHSGGSEMEEEEDNDDKEDTETWVQWMVRTSRLADEAMKRARIDDWYLEQKRRKWRWAGHVARRENERWAKRMLNWEPRGGRRGVGRPVLRWEDPLVASARQQGATPWQEIAQDRARRQELEEDFLKVL